MNTLQAHLRAAGLDETHAMNRLQSAGIISDLAVTDADVPEPDATSAVCWLRLSKDIQNP